MRSLIIASTIAGLVTAAPAPQDIDFDLAYALPDVSYTQSIGATNQIITYNPTTVFSAAASQVTASQSDLAAAVITSGENSNTLEKRGACASQASGYGPVPTDDSASAFRAYVPFATSASAAPVPTGYTQEYMNSNGSSNAYGYMGYTTLKTYDSNACAAKCNALNGCISFNIYFERDPTVVPGTGCTNPSSTTNIKCVFWGGPISSADAVNTGQWQSQFEVAIAGSNGYVNNSVASVPGYKPAVFLGKAAISAPYDVYGYSSYLGNTIFRGAFDANLCAQACTAKSNYAIAHPPTDGTPVQTCQFFNTYILYINNTSNMQGQYCAMYAESWGPSYATNDGQYSGNDHFLIEYSFSYSNATNPGSPNPLAAVYQAKSEILRPSNTAAGSAYCSSILGYTTPVVTVTATATIAPVATTTITDVEQITATAIAVVATTVVVTQTTVVTANVRRDVAAASASLTVYSNGITALALPQFTAAAQKRALSTPSFLTKYPASIVNSACSMVATPVSSTSTVTNTATQTFSTSYTTSTVIATSYVTITDTEFSTTTATQVVTSTAAPACTSAYQFQVSGGQYDGQYITAPEPDQTLDSVTYTFVSATSSADDATSWQVRSNGNVYALDNSGGWITQYSGVYYWLEATDYSNSVYEVPRATCAVFSGSLSCVDANSQPLNLGFCEQTDNDFMQWQPGTPSEGCVAVTINAISVTSC